MTSREIFRVIGKALVGEFPIQSMNIYSMRPMRGCARVIGVGVRTDRSTDSCFIEPTISVRLVELEEIMCAIAPVTPRLSLNQSSSLSIQLGYLEPNNSYHSWGIMNGADPAPVIDEMRQAILTYGPKFWDRFASKESIIDSIERGEYTWPSNRPYKLPIAYGISNRHEEAIQFLTDTAAKTKSRAYDQFVRHWFGHFVPGVAPPI